MRLTSNIVLSAVLLSHSAIVHGSFLDALYSTIGLTSSSSNAASFAAKEGVVPATAPIASVYTSTSASSSSSSYYKARKAQAATSPITDFVLVNTKTGKDIMIMLDGMTIDTSEYGTELTIRVETTSALTSDFVKIDFDKGTLKRVEGMKPYYLAGDENGVIYTANSLAVPGEHTMVACPSETPFFAANDAHEETGKRRKLNEDPLCLTMTFTTVEDISIPIPPPTAAPVEVGTIETVVTDVPPAEAGIYGILTGELMVWHKITLAFSGPPASETGMTIPGTYRPPSVFPDYRLDVTFTAPNGNSTYTVPGYYVGNGDSANDLGVSGNVWQVHLTPTMTGTWTWTAKFVEGTNVAQNGGGNPAGFFDGATGSFAVQTSNVTDTNDLRSKGRLLPVPGSNLFRFANGETFIKVGPDSPQNLFAYLDFDGTPNNGNYSKSYEPHVADYNLGDPTFAGGKGTGLIGAINYLAKKGMNILSVTTLNLDGDDKNVHPFVTVANQLQYDISKLAQWSIVLDHAERMGLAIRFKLQDGASDMVLNKGELFEERKLYYREIIARFGHHLATIWDIGEDISSSRIIDRTAYIREVDPYDSPIIVRSSQSSTPIADLIAIPTLDGVSLITPTVANVNADTAAWISGSTDGIAVSCDEQGTVATGVAPDFQDPTHDTIRKDVLWGNLMAGGTGTQYYFGTSIAESDLTLQDFRSRDALWDQSKYALDFFKVNKIPIEKMGSRNSLVSSGSLCLATEDLSTIVVYVKTGISVPTIQLDTGSYTVSWYNPRTGGGLLQGSITAIVQSGLLGSPPTDAVADWVILLVKA